MKVAILNSGIGSIHSLCNSLQLLGISSEVVTTPQQLSSYSRVILPGVGHFDEGSSFISQFNWAESIRNFLAEPSNRLLGICLGMQLLFSSSEESDKCFGGLSLVNAKIELLPLGEAKVPNLGWLQLTSRKSTGHFITKSVDRQDFYFVHSYALMLHASDCVIADFDEYAISLHGSVPFVSMFRSANVYGCQFHPEKSSKAGLSVLKNFFG